MYIVTVCLDVQVHVGRFSHRLIYMYSTNMYMYDMYMYKTAVPAVFDLLLCSKAVTAPLDFVGRFVDLELAPFK